MRQLGTSSTRTMPADRARRREAATDAEHRLRFSTFGGAAAIGGAILAVAGNALVRGAEPQVPADVVSYPLSAHAFQLGQVFFALTQFLMALGIIALARLEIAGDGRAARVGALLAVAGFLLTVPGELVLALVADAPLDSAQANAASSVFGLAV